MSKRDYTSRNQKLRNRRLGSEAIAKSDGVTFDAAPLVESYEKRAKSESLKYALGAMQEVEKKYTEISFEQGNRVSNQLTNGMTARQKSIEIKLQGSLALNIHLRRYSDVDLLVFPLAFFLYDQTGPKSSTYSPSDKDRIQVVKELRSNCATILASAFPQALVDESGAKCITLSGGSLSRSVDVVPALWFDTSSYQTTLALAERGVEIFDSHKLELNGNFPFKYMEHINNKDTSTIGGTKKAIRLLKTLKYDADSEVGISSFDIASLVWHMPDVSLRYPNYLEPALLVSIQNFLNQLCGNRAYAETLLVADGTRKIIRSSDDFSALIALNEELKDLIESIASELKPYEAIDAARARSVLLEANIQ